MARLPKPGGDNNTWGNVLNDFLEESHNSDGTLKTTALSAAGAYTKPSTGIPKADLDGSTQTTLGSVSAKATDSAVVHLAGTETITGAKAFSIAPTVPSNSFPESAVTNLTTDLAAKATPAQAQASLSMSAIIVSGAATVTSNILPPGLRIGYASTLGNIYVRMGSAPTGSGLTVVVNRNSSPIATLTVPATSYTASSTGLSIALNANDIITFDITAIGSVFAGSDVAVDLIGS